MQSSDDQSRSQPGSDDAPASEAGPQRELNAIAGPAGEAEAGAKAAKPDHPVGDPEAVARDSNDAEQGARGAKHELVMSEASTRDVARKADPEIKTPGSALISVVPAAERFEQRQDASDFQAPPRRAKMQNRLFVYTSRAALIVFLLGGAYVASGQLFHAGTPAKSERVAEIAPAQSAPKRMAASASAAPSATALAPSTQAPTAASTAGVDRAEFRRVTHEMSEEIRGLKASLESLRASVAQAQNAEEPRGFKKGLDGLKSGLEASKTETNNAIAQLSAKIEHMQREQTAKLQQMLERVERAEKASASLTTGSIAPLVTANNAPTGRQASPPSPASANGPEGSKKSAQFVSNWVVRDVYDGIALVEGPNGAFEVMPGEMVPGLGMVKTIERRGNGWVVVTNHGNVEYARE